MNRVFRGALFPILIVIVLAFFVAKLFGPSTSTGVIHNYQSFTTQDLPQGLHLPAHVLQHLVNRIDLDVALLEALHGEADRHMLRGLH